MTYEKTADRRIEHEAGSGKTGFAVKMMVTVLLRLFTDSAAIPPVGQ